MRSSAPRLGVINRSRGYRREGKSKLLIMTEDLGTYEAQGSFSFSEKSKRHENMDLTHAVWLIYFILFVCSFSSSFFSYYRKVGEKRTELKDQ